MADYESFLYDSHAFAETHPDRLGTIGALFGMTPAPAERCRVLELGCGLAGNLVPWGALFPNSEFVGVDLSQRQVEIGQADVDALGLTNIRLFASDIMHITPDLGFFDYIICHGVFSWVPDTVRERILAICRVHLAPQGVAYISYNTHPGWRCRGMIRDMLRRHVDPGPPEAQIAQARELISLLTDHTPASTNVAAAWMKEELALIGKMSDAYLLYEHLVEENTAFWFDEFVQRAGTVGLQYLGDADFSSMTAWRYGDQVTARVGALATNLLETEQYLDYLGVRFFRRTLLCRQEVDLDRHFTGERLAGCWFAPRFQRVAPGEIRAQGTPIEVGDTLVNAVLDVMLCHPHGVYLDRLLSIGAQQLDEAPSATQLAAVRTTLLELYATGAVEIGHWRRPWTPIPDKHPRTPSFVRRYASTGTGVTTLGHRKVTVDLVDRAILLRLDGRHVDEVYAAIFADLEHARLEITRQGEPVTTLEQVVEMVDDKLERFARIGLLLSPGTTDVGRIVLER